jgi:hypothetical protein
MQAPHAHEQEGDTVDTSIKSWTLLLGSTIVAGMIATGHVQLLVDGLSAAGDVLWWLVRPIGPAQ